MFLFLLPFLAQAGVTATPLFEEKESPSGVGDCAVDEAVQVVITKNVTLTEESWSAFDELSFLLEGQHKKCTILISRLSMTLDGGKLIDMPLNLSGFNEKNTDWHLSSQVIPDAADPVKLGVGAHTLVFTLDGRADDLTNKMRLTVDGEWLTWHDLDGDGATDADLPGGTDCNDDDDEIFPGADEVYYDGVDQNCDGLSDYDADVDGFDGIDPNDGTLGDDCDDSNAAIFPGAAEIWYDGVDQNCDGADDYDQDGDGIKAKEHGGTDCDDTDKNVAPYGRNYTPECEYFVDDDNSRGLSALGGSSGCTKGGPAAAGLLFIGLLGGRLRRRRTRGQIS